MPSFIKNFPEIFLFNRASLHAKLNSHYKALSYKKKIKKKNAKSFIVSFEIQKIKGAY